MNLLKLQRSDATVRAITPSRVVSQAQRGALNATADPTSAPSAFAPPSPAMVSSARSSGAAARLAPTTAPARPDSPLVTARGRLAAAAAFTTRPGRKSDEFAGFALVAVRTPRPKRSRAVYPGRRPMAAAVREVASLPNH